MTRNKLSATEVRNLRTLLLLSVFDPVAVGARIAQARNEAGLNQDDLADLIGVSTRTHQGYEIGERIPFRHMDKYAGVLNRRVEWLLHGEEPAKPEARAEVDREMLEKLDLVLSRLDQLEERAEARERRDASPPRGASS